MKGELKYAKNIHPDVSPLPSIPTAAVQVLVYIGTFLTNNLVSIEVVTTGAVSFYSFVYKRPELILEVEFSHVFQTQPDGGDVEASLMLLLANVGNSSAEEVQLTITADAFKFDNDIEPTDSITSAYEPPQAVMEIRSGRKSGFIGGGRRHDIYLENIVYERDVQELWLGSAVFDNGEHDLKYQVSCKEHGPRKGKISFKVFNGEVEITGRKYPTYRRQLKPGYVDGLSGSGPKSWIILMRTMSSLVLSSTESAVLLR